MIVCDVWGGFMSGEHLARSVLPIEEALVWAKQELEAVKTIEDDWTAKERQRVGNPAWRVPPPTVLHSFVSHICQASAKRRMDQRLAELRELKR